LRGGTGYFRLRAVRPHLESGRLRLVRGAPQFHHTAYLVYSESADANLLDAAIRGFRQIVIEEKEQQKAPALVRTT